jgi:hypothetical protein
MAFSLASTVQTGAAVLRVSFAGNMPLSASPRGRYDARNPNNWGLLGPAEVIVEEVRTVSADPFSFDLICNAPVTAGSWILSAANIQTVAGDTLDSADVSFDAVGPQPFFSVPSDQITSETTLRQALNAALDGPGWRAFIAALGYSDEKVAKAGKAAFYQRLLATATQIYLERLTTSYGVDRPPNVRMSDDTLRKLTIALNNNKVNVVGLEAVLLAYYGLDATVAHVQAELAEPYELADEDSLSFNVDGNEVLVTFRDDDFTTIGAAAATEVAAVINRQLWLQGLRAFAMANTDTETGDVYVRIYSSLSGIKGRLKFFGGNAMQALRFPEYLGTTQAVGTQWNFEPSAIGNGVTVGKVRLTWTGGTDPQLSIVRPGDYVNIYGAPFDAVNRSHYLVTATAPDWVEFEDSGFTTSQTGVVQVGEVDIFFVRPLVNGLNGKYVAAVVGCDINSAEILLPTTAAAVERDATTGWYLNGETALAIDDTYANGRAGTTVTIKTVEPHGLTAGRFFFLDELTYDYTASLGAVQETLGTTPAPASSYCYGAAKLQDGRLMALFMAAADTSAIEAYLFDPDTNTWDAGTATPMSGTANNQPALIALADGRVLMVGTTQFCIFDPETDAWGSLGATPEADIQVNHRGLTLLADDRVLFVYSGWLSAFGVHSSIFDPDTSTWSTPTVVTADYIGEMSTVVIGSRGDVVAAGGVGTLGAELQAFYFTAASESWAALADMPTGMMFPNSVFVPSGAAGQVWVLGSDGAGGLLQFNILDVTTRTWTQRALVQTTTRQTTAVTVVGQRVFVCPDINTLTWELHDAGLPGSAGSRALTSTSGLCSTLAGVSIPHCFALDDGRIVAFTQEASTVSGTTKAYMSLSSQRQRSAGQLAGGPFLVTAAPTTNIVQFETPEVSSYTAITGGLLTPVRAENGNAPSCFMLNPEDGVALAGPKTELTDAVSKGLVPAVIDVGDTTDFPDEPGYITLSFGTAEQSMPIRYLGVASGTQLRLDPNERLSYAYGVGAAVNLLVGKGVFAPATTTGLGITWLTDSSVGRVEAERDLDQVVGVGLNVIKRVLYPGDRGLGNEGQPLNGVAKVSDAVGIWGSNDYLAELAAAREDD